METASTTTVSDAPATETSVLSPVADASPGGNLALESSSLPTDHDPCLRILRKGDLVRVRAGLKMKLEKRDGALAKITKTIPIPLEELEKVVSGYPVDHHPFLYNMDFVLGGRASNIHRRELVYTTATAEGMISESGERSSRRKRKPSSVALEGSPEAKNDTTTSKPKQKKQGTKKKATGGKRKDGASKGTSGSESKKAKHDGEKASASNGGAAPGSYAQDLYVKHHREFERMATRLEKVDHFGFFFDTPSEPNSPVKLASSVSPSLGRDSQVSIGTGSTKISIGPAHESSMSTPTTATSPTTDPTNSIPIIPPQAVAEDPFAKPPRTWYDIRKRRESGRYELDRVKLSEEERRKRLQPYKTWKRKQGKGTLTKKSRTRKGALHPRVLHPKGVDWDIYRSDVLAMCKEGVLRDPEQGHGGSGTLGHAAMKIMDEMEKMYERTGKRQQAELETSDARHEFSQAIQSQPNQEAAMQVEWRTLPFPERKYERLSSDVICAGLSAVDAISSSYEMQTTLEDSFVGISYKYNDNGQSEGWMKSVLDESINAGVQESSKNERMTAEALRNDGGVVKAQVQTCMQSLLIAVQDKVMTEAGVVNHRELRSANWEGNGPDDVSDDGNDHMNGEVGEPELVEQSVWGIDCYTRRNIVICLETEFEQELVLEFIEKWLLPAINACPEDLAHDLTNSAKLLEGLKLRDIPKSAEETKSADDRDEQWSHSLIGQALLTKIRTTGPPWLKVAAHQLRRAIVALGNDFFRVHPKGHGSIVLSPKLKANTLVTFYRGEVYPSWRWGEKMDAIDMTQDRLGLRPNLPDFYNMALERPQADPRGYGLMIVDGSRKAGHGSMLSHSCQPTCEVRVAARDGELCLAMTTLRELQQGEELTFDYNAVTESLNEYQAAVCLCGNRSCRGSFLHFATADCYQQVLNRNSPIAVRFSNLLKGCMKKVMASNDEDVLKNHGFGTAAFGAVSLNRHVSIGMTGRRRDSMEAVPVWLRTYVADTLRYIEYERRALPIALLCDHVDMKKPNESKEKDPITAATTMSKPKRKEGRDKPENVFMFFARHRTEDLKKNLLAQNEKGKLETDTTPESNLRSGIAQRHEILRMASTEWKVLSAEEKAKWKDRSIQEFREKKKHDPEARRTKPEQEPASSKKAKSNGKLKGSKKEEFNLSKISFEAADAEGVSAMEQRIQQLTQALSRVGRVLDRHRESALATTGFLSSTRQIHPPVSMVDEDRIVQWLWNDASGPIQSLLRGVSEESYCSPSLHRSILNIKRKYDEQLGSSNIPDKKGTISLALLDMRACLQSYVVDFVSDKKRYDLLRAKQRRDAAKRKREREMSKTLEADANLGESQQPFVPAVQVITESQTEGIEPLPRDSRFDYFGQRWKLEAVADLLLMYAHTSTYLAVNPYNRLESTPVEVYARELGNAVPRSVIESSTETDSTPGGVVIISRESDDDGSRTDEDSCQQTQSANPKKGGDLCQPDDIITNVTVAYEGDFVLSQLLQWYNGGIGQKQGLPNMLGCCVLPSVSECFLSKYAKGGNSKSETIYASEIRPHLASWFEDSHQRGSPFPDEVQAVFSNSLSPYGFFPIGSPVLDLLIMGDDMNLNMVIAALSENVDASSKATLEGKSKTAKGRLQSTVDEGMPAQAVANWVQCENPKCLKWRKLPWHVDLDLLPEKFFCKDNVWNPKANSCDSLEDEWDEYDSQIKGGGLKKETDASMFASLTIEANVCNGLMDKDFFVGAKFDILRPKKKRYFHAEIKQVARVGNVRRVRVHYAKTPEKFDEWLDLPCERIFALDSKVMKDVKREKPLQEAPLKPIADNGNTLKSPADDKSPSERTSSGAVMKEDDKGQCSSETAVEKVLERSGSNDNNGVVIDANVGTEIEMPDWTMKTKESSTVRKRLSKVGQSPKDRGGSQSHKKLSVASAKQSRENKVPKKKPKSTEKTPRPGSIPRKSSIPQDSKGSGSLIASLVVSGGLSPSPSKREGIPADRKDQIPRKRSPDSEKAAGKHVSSLLSSVVPRRSPVPQPRNRNGYSNEGYQGKNGGRMNRPHGQPSQFDGHFDGRHHDKVMQRNGSFYRPKDFRGRGDYSSGPDNAHQQRSSNRYDDDRHHEPRSPTSKSHPLLGSRFERKHGEG